MTNLNLNFVWSLLQHPSLQRLRGRVYTTIWKLSRRLGRGEHAARVMPLPFGLYLKKAYPQEVLATQYVREHTTIPVPRILDVVPFWRDQVYILMTRVPGEELGKSAGHIRNLSPRQLQVLEDTLRDWFGQLRALEPPDPDAVCGFGGNGIKSYRIRHDEYVGPFASQKEFHEELVSGYEATHGVMAAASHSRPHRICFTHGDITPHNILLNEDMRPVGLIDWECAGWLPEYWEYTYALYIRYPRYKEWSDLFTRIFPQYGVELEVEYELWEIAAPW
ncbi:hypothetical protein POSPLADRAFT_1040111 [Postia placenta MAD-698-R-SB12]|uniref:Aminoglycoside phosphotransferase domain-containing protein n=1 Tax=Postia placenta MAD-698-R-SB12 TaxID=670580 RepID=A0A1X6MYX8_9APHY|nr:hypothetical protein POSPLADRAFT_1040111 [Postia placenta MAD-698-R-SB12]OSX61557.1 hypothetical protein POSPLADRAFT_1040111 [Postia placenta MAD-698-R-SB12]